MNLFKFKSHTNKCIEKMVNPRLQIKGSKFKSLLIYIYDILSLYLYLMRLNIIRTDNVILQFLICIQFVRSKLNLSCKAVWDIVFANVAFIHDLVHTKTAFLQKLKFLK
jgi:hypothetical protein